MTGRVTAAGTGEPLVEARVMVVNTSVIVLDQRRRTLHVAQRPDRHDRIRVIRVGYQEQKKSVDGRAGATR